MDGGGQVPRSWTAVGISRLAGLPPQAATNMTLVAKTTARTIPNKNGNFTDFSFVIFIL